MYIDINTLSSVRHELLELYWEKWYPIFIRGLVQIKNKIIDLHEISRIRWYIEVRLVITEAWMKAGEKIGGWYPKGRGCFLRWWQHSKIIMMVLHLAKYTIKPWLVYWGERKCRKRNVWWGGYSYKVASENLIFMNSLNRLELNCSLGLQLPEQPACEPQRSTVRWRQETNTHTHSPGGTLNPWMQKIPLQVK